MGKRNFDDYVPVSQRIVQAREKYGDKLYIDTDVSTFPEQGAMLIKAEVGLWVENGAPKRLATGHAFTNDLTEEKIVEKTESVAIGRALANAGFWADATLNVEVPSVQEKSVVRQVEPLPSSECPCEVDCGDDCECEEPDVSTTVTKGFSKPEAPKNTKSFSDFIKNKKS